MIDYPSVETGKYPISMGTSMALEGLFGIHDNSVPNQTPPITKCDVVAINAKTLIRNILAAVDKNMLLIIKPYQLVNLVISEILTIKNIVDVESMHKTNVLMYIPTYKLMGVKYRHAIFKEPSTPKQIQSAKFEEDCVKLLLEKRSDIHVSLSITDHEIHFTNKPRVLLITHLAIDLLHCHGESTLGLLESHTGIVKFKNQWYTKLKNGKDLYRIPFDRMSIQFFGDSGGMFSPLEIKMRKRLLEIANAKQWTQLTTKNKIVSDIMQSYEPVLASIITGLY